MEGDPIDSQQRRWTLRTRPRAPQHRVPGEAGVWIFSGVLGVVGIALSYVVFDWRAPVERPAPFLLVVLLFLAVEALRVDIEVGTHSHAIAMCEIGLVVGVLTARPIDVVLAQVVAVAVVFGLARRLPLVKLVFNIAQVLAVTALGVIVIRAVGISDAISERVAAAGLIGGFTVGLVNILALGLVSHIAGHRHDARESVRELIYSVAGSVASAAIGLQMVLLGRESAWLVSLAAVPVALMYVAFRSYAGQRRAAERSEFLHHAAIALHDSSNLDEGLLAMLDHTRAAVRAEFARVVLFTNDGAVSVMAHRDPAQQLAMGAATAEATTAAQLLMHGLHRAALLDGADPAARALLRALAVRDAIAVPLQRNGEQSGLLLAGNRLGDFDEFRRDDLRLVELVANQIGVALEKGWLEQSLRQLIELETRLQHQANHDGLTGVANRRLFNERVEGLFERRDRPGAALILVDLDDFKSVNDTHGHVVGDDLLSVVAERLHTGVRAGDLVARIGGDEFAILLGGVDGPATAIQRASAIVDAVRQPALVQGRMIVVRTSIGVALADSTAAHTGGAAAQCGCRAVSGEGARQERLRAVRSGDALRGRSPPATHPAGQRGDQRTPLPVALPADPRPRQRRGRRRRDHGPLEAPGARRAPFETVPRPRPRDGDDRRARRADARGVVARRRRSGQRPARRPSVQAPPQLSADRRSPTRR